MESPEELEKALSRLMPSALSEGGLRSLDELIDGLAAGEDRVPSTPVKGFSWQWLAGGAAAAAAVVLAVTFPFAAPQDSLRGGGLAGGGRGIESGMLKIGHSERVEAAVPEDWLSESDGVAHRAWRLRVVDVERLQDLETGYEVSVSRPREQVVLMPVTAF